MDVASLLVDLYGRVPHLTHDVVDGVELTTLMQAPAPGTNPIAWLIWHVARVQDQQVAELIDEEQIWVQDDWASRFGLDADPSDIGYGHSAAQVAAVRPTDPAVLLEYLDVVDRRTRTMLQSLTPADLDRIIDATWDPPVTLGVRLLSVADDALQHIGQAAYVRGLLKD